jgi:hypothetical protein
MAITTKATSNFSFRKLADKFDEVFDDYMEDSYEDLAEFARENIRSSTGIRKLKGFTKAARRNGWSKKGYGGKTSSETPLLHTGNLLRSIKATKNGVQVVGYAKYHMEGFTVVKNAWTKRFLTKKGYDKLPTKVAPRNPFLTKTGNLKPAFKKGSDKRMKRLIRNINKVWRTSTK